MNLNHRIEFGNDRKLLQKQNAAAAATQHLPHGARTWGTVRPRVRV